MYVGYIRFWSFFGYFKNSANASRINKYTLMICVYFQLAKDFGDEFTNHIEEYLEKVVHRTQYDIGRCWPVSQAYNATIIAGCSRILSPFVSENFYFIQIVRVF